MRKRVITLVVSAALTVIAFPVTASASCTDVGFGCTETHVCTAVNKVKQTNCIE